MPIWQNHEQRITKLEHTMENISSKMDSVENTVKEGNKEQKELLDMMNTRMVDEFFNKKSLHFSNGWKLVFFLTGGGSILYLLIDKFF